MTVSMYCVKCREKRDVEDAQEIVMPKNGRKAVQGTCPVCGTKTFRIGGMPQPDATK
jgi:hypothetical protein